MSFKRYYSNGGDLSMLYISPSAKNTLLCVCVTVKGTWDGWEPWNLCNPPCGANSKRARKRYCKPDYSKYRSVYERCWCVDKTWAETKSLLWMGIQRQLGHTDSDTVQSPKFNRALLQIRKPPTWDRLSERGLTGLASLINLTCFTHNHVKFTACENLLDNKCLSGSVCSPTIGRLKEIATFFGTPQADCGAAPEGGQKFEVQPCLNVPACT